jgi:hypothetical protein
MTRTYLVAGAAALVLAGCGGSDSGPTTVERTVTEPAPASEPPEEPDAGGGSSQGKKIKVPNVVGKDHQLAQDTMQAAGLYHLVEEDATGQDRVLLYDRNWTVVSQSPPAGSRVSEDKAIVLRAKKDGE